MHNGLVRLILLQIRDSGRVKDPPGLAVRDGSFESIADLDPGLSLAHGEQEQHTVVQLFVTKSILAQSLVPVLFNIGSAESGYGKHGDLGLRRILERAAQLIQLRLLLSR
ncbi:hypothetical protein D3C81_2041110 [compost metagenome]